MLRLTDAEKYLLADLEKVEATGRIDVGVARGLVMRGLIEGPLKSRRLTDSGMALLTELRLRRSPENRPV